MTFELLMDTGNLVVDPILSITSWMPDFYATFMSNPASSIIDFFDLSNINFEFIGDIGEFIGDVLAGLLEFVAGLFG